MLLKCICSSFPDFQSPKNRIRSGAVAEQSQCQTPGSALLFQKEAEAGGALCLQSHYWKVWESILCCVIDFCSSIFIFQLLECAPLAVLKAGPGKSLFPGSHWPSVGAFSRQQRQQLCSNEVGRGSHPGATVELHKPHQTQKATGNLRT